MSVLGICGDLVWELTWTYWPRKALLAGLVCLTRVFCLFRFQLFMCVMELEESAFHVRHGVEERSRFEAYVEHSELLLLYLPGS